VPPLQWTNTARGGLAPVVTDIPAVRIWVLDQENGFLFFVGDHKELATKITVLLEDRGIQTNV